MERVGGGDDREVTRADHARTLWAMVRTVAFILNEVGAMEDSSRGGT